MLITKLLSSGVSVCHALHYTFFVGLIGVQAYSASATDSLAATDAGFMLLQLTPTSVFQNAARDFAKWGGNVGRECDPTDTGCGSR